MMFNGHKVACCVSCVGVFHKGRPPKIPVLLPPGHCPLLSACGLPLPCFEDVNCCMVWQCNSSCSQIMLPIDLIITTCSSKQRQTQQRVHVNKFTMGARPISVKLYYILLHKSYKMNNLQFILRHQLHHP